MAVKTKNNSATVRELSGADDAISQFERLGSVLAATHSEIPQLLAGATTLRRQLGLAESQGQGASTLRESLAATESGREAAVRRRSACLGGIVNLEPELKSARADLEREQRQAAEQISREFGQRWREASDRLSALREEAALLRGWLRCTIPTPAPESRPVASEQAPPHIVALVAKLDAIDAALARIAAIKQARQFDQRHFELSRIRRTPVEFVGLYVVTTAVDSLEDGLRFEAGTLVDSSLMGPGQMHRLVQARRIRPAESAVSAAA